MSIVRFTRRRALVALALLPTAETLAAAPQTPPAAAQKPEPPAPKTVVLAIGEAEQLRKDKKFAEAIAVLEARQKELGTLILPSEKRALLLAVADTHYLWAEQEKSLYKWRETIPHYQSAYAIDKEYRLRDAALYLNNIGDAYRHLADYTKALEFYSKALPLSQKVGDKEGEAAIINGLGLVYSCFGEKSKALKYYNKSLLIRKQVGDKIGEAIALSNIGGTYGDLGEKTKELAAYYKTLSLWQQLGYKSNEAVTLGNIGLVYNGLGDWAKALECYNKSLPLHQQIGDKTGQATVLTNIGGVYSELSDKNKALAFYNRALSLYQQVGNKEGEAADLNNIGSVYRSLGDNAKALEFSTKALLLIQQVGDKEGEAATLSNIGGIFTKIGDNARALEFYNKALPLQQEIGDKEGEAITLNSTGSVYSVLGECAKALELYNKALPLRQQIGDKFGEAVTTYDLMLLFNNAKSPFRSPAIAVTFGKQSINLYQALRANIKTLDKSLQASFTKKVEPTYRKLADILISQGRLPEAQQVLGLLKDQEFGDFIRRDAKLIDGTPQADLTPREAAAKKRYDTAGSKITALAAEYDTTRRAYALSPTPARKTRLADLSRALDAAQADFTKVLGAITADFAAAPKNDGLNKLKTVQETEDLTSTLGTLSEQTGQNAVAVYTLVAPERVHCILVTPSVQIARSTEIKDTDLNKLVADFRKALENPNLDPRPLGKKLYDILVGPIAADLKGANAQSILWSLDGTLRYVPLAALSPDGKTYLVQQTTQSSLFTPATLLNLKDAPDKNGWKAAAFGVTSGRTENGVSFNDLPGVEDEIVAIGKTVPTRSFVDSAFTEAAFRDALLLRPPVVHIASHFAFKPGNPTASFLLLGKGTLSLDTITKSRVSLFDGVKLLTLSACDTATGGGAEENGGEVESFALLAQKKGAGAVLASLWPVNDASTQALMQTFYALHKAKPALGKAECLRQTQVALLSGAVKPSLTERGTPGTTAPSAPDSAFVPFVPDANAPCAHPFYWAAFTLIGNTK